MLLLTLLVNLFLVNHHLIGISILALLMIHLFQRMMGQTSW